jgi:hypothetical protein
MKVECDNLMMFVNDKCFGLFNIGQNGLDENTAVCIE